MQNNIKSTLCRARESVLRVIKSTKFKWLISKIPLAEMAVDPEYKSQALLLACNGSKEMYKKIEENTGFCQYLEGFYSSICNIKERDKLKNILRLTH